MNSTFAADVDALNYTKISADMVMLPIGRSYVFGGKPTDENVHIGGVATLPNFQFGLIEEFGRRAEEQPDLYIGIGGMINLSYIASLKPKAAILIDVNPLQTVFWRQNFSEIGEAEKPEEYRKKTASTSEEIRKTLTEQFRNSDFSGTHRIKYYTDSYFRIMRSTTSETIVHENRPENFLRVDGGYDHIRQMIQLGNIAGLTLDIADTEAVKQLLDVLGRYSGMRASHIHLSNAVSMMSLNRFETTDWSKRINSREKMQRVIQNITDLSQGNDPMLIEDKDHIGIPDLHTYL